VRACVVVTAAAMSGRGRVRREELPSAEYGDGEVSFRLPTPVRASSSVWGGLQLSVRRHRSPSVTVEPEELQMPASFTLARFGSPLVDKLPSAIAARSPAGAGTPSTSSASSMPPPIQPSREPSSV
jgi:hypothetical protein